MVDKIPQDMNTVTPSLSVDGAAEAVALYIKAFGAKEMHPPIAAPNGKIMHATIMIGDSHIFLNDTDPQMCAEPSASSFYVYMEDVDAAVARAKGAGLEEVYPVADMFWGDRMGVVKDKFGINWALATHVKDVSEEEMEKAKNEMFAQA